MLFEFIVAVSAYCVYRGRKKRGKRNVASRALLSPCRAEQIGAAGEAAAHAELRRSLSWLCGNDFYLHDGPLVIEHAPGTGFPTAEIDHLAVTPFGIFIFETKNWSGHIGPSTDKGKLVRTTRNGQADERRSPIEQNRSKLRFLRTQLPPMWPVRGAGLFTSNKVVLDPRLPADLLSLSDIPQWLRMHRDAFGDAKPVSVAHARKAVLFFADDSEHALAKHKASVTGNSGTKLLDP
jgi:hypothetical protein